MVTHNRWAFGLATVGLIGLIASMLDPLEGSILAVASAVALAAGARIGHSRLRRPLDIALAMIILGVAVMFWFSALGGIGGDSGRSIWLGLFILPYPIGWVVALLFGVRLVRVTRAA